MDISPSPPQPDILFVICLRFCLHYLYNHRERDPPVRFRWKICHIIIASGSLTVFHLPFEKIRPETGDREFTEKIRQIRKNVGFRPESLFFCRGGA